MTMIRQYSIPLMLMLIASCAVQKKSYTQFSDWDTNLNDELDRTEFENAYVAGSYFDKWAKRGSSISYTELYSTVYHSVDVDSSSAITNDEFNVQMKAFHFGMLRSDFAQWDEDNNNSIDIFEFNKHVGAGNLASLWDTDGDGSISEREMAAGMFYQCDANNNGRIDQAEFDLWRRAR